MEFRHVVYSKQDRDIEYQCGYVKWKSAFPNKSQDDMKELQYQLSPRMTSYDSNDQYLHVFKLPQGIEFIENECFAGYNTVQQIILPNSVRFVGKGCFAGSDSLESVILSSSMTSLPDNCFANCSNLKEVIGLENIKLRGVDCFKNCVLLKL